MPVQPTTDGEEKSWRDWVRSNATQIVGLTAIFVALFYLLAGFMAALDATAFQERVLRVVGDNNIDRARAVLTKLDELESRASPLQPADGGGLPFGALALQLDRVKLATAELARFNDALTLPLPRFENDEPDGEQTLEAWFRDRGTDLQNDFAGLDAALEEAIPGIAVMRSLDMIKNTTAELHKALPPDKLSKAAPATLVDFDRYLGELEGGLKNLAGDLPPEHLDATTIKESLDSSFDQVSELRSYANGPIARMAAEASNVQELMTAVTTQITDLDEQLTTAKPSLLQDEFGKLELEISDLTQALVAMPIDLLNGENTTTDETTTDDVPDQVVELAARVNALSAPLKATLPTIDAVEELTASLAQMSLAVESLDSMEVNEADISTRIGERELRGLPAAELFREKLDVLGEATSAMAEALAGVSVQGEIALLLANDPDANHKAGVIFSDFSSFGRYGFPLSAWAAFGFDPKSLAVSSREGLDILLILMIGAIGSMIYMTQLTLRLAIHGHADGSDQRMPFSWYVFRPVFGAVVAFALYLVYKTGQVALGSGGLSSALQSGVNIPILTVLGLFAGLLSWQVLEMIQSKGEVWLARAERRDLWATGLLRALDAKEQTPESCARHLGYTIGQVDRWIALKDKVTPEMQDRVSTWLGISRDEIFSSLAPNGSRRDRSMYAVGLKPYLQRADAKYDEMSIAKALVVDPEIVERWRDQKLAVSSNLQWTLVELLGERYADFYSSGPDQQKYWAVGWRSLDLPAELNAADQLAATLGVSASLIRDWRDLEKPVPAKTATHLVELFEVGQERLFDLEFDRASNCYRVKQPALTDAIVKRYKNVRPLASGGAAPPGDGQITQEQAMAAFAREMDIPESKLQAWLAGEQKLYQPTCDAICRLLGKPLDELFVKLT